MKNLTVRQHHWISLGIAILGMLMAGLPICGIGSKVLFWVGLAIIMAASVYNIHFVRCPHCGERPRIPRYVPEYCPHCGKKMDDH